MGQWYGALRELIVGLQWADHGQRERQSGEEHGQGAVASSHYKIVNDAASGSSVYLFWSEMAMGEKDTKHAYDSVFPRISQYL